MRDALKRSIADSPIKNQDRYAKGSIVLCNHCSLPIYKLERGIGVGEKAGRGTTAFRPVTMQDLADLAERRDVDAGLIAKLNAWPVEARHQHTLSIDAPKAGDPMLCPVCGNTFVQVLSTERSDTIDQAYVIELVTIPPIGTQAAPLKGRRNFFVHS